MLQLLYAVIFMEMLMIISFLFKTPLRNLVIISLNTVKRGQGPVVVKTVAAALVVMLCSGLYSIYKIQRRSLESVAIVDPTNQVLLSNHVLQASLLGFVLFLSLVIDRLHHYIREIRVLRKSMENAKNQNRSFENNKNNNLVVENKTLKEEIDALRSKVKKLKYECQVKEIEVEALKKQSQGVPYG